MALEDIQAHCGKAVGKEISHEALKMALNNRN